MAMQISVTIGAMDVHEGSLASKFQIARKYHRPALTQKGLANALGVSTSTIGMIESGDRKPRRELVEVAAIKTGFPIDWWYDEKSGPPPLRGEATGTGSAFGSSPPAPSNRSHLVAEAGVGRRKFPLVGNVGAATFPLESGDPWPGDFVEFSDDLYRPERFAIHVRGDSMSPRFDHGDYILVQPSSEVEPGLIAVAHNGEYEYVTKVLRLGEERRKELHPINPDYEILTPDRQWRIVGYAVGWRRERGVGRYIEEGDNAGLRP